TLHLLGQVLVHVVPVLAVLFQKVLELRLIVDDKAVIAQHRQSLGHGFHPGGRGLDAQFKPLHGSSSYICARRGITIYAIVYMKPAESTRVLFYNSDFLLYNESSRKDGLYDHGTNHAKTRRLAPVCPDRPVQD